MIKNLQSPCSIIWYQWKLGHKRGTPCDARERYSWSCRTSWCLATEAEISAALWAHVAKKELKAFRCGETEKVTTGWKPFTTARPTIPICQSIRWSWNHRLQATVPLSWLYVTNNKRLSSASNHTHSYTWHNWHLSPIRQDHFQHHDTIRHDMLF